MLWSGHHIAPQEEAFHPKWSVSHHRSTFVVSSLVPTAPTRTPPLATPPLKPVSEHQWSNAPLCFKFDERGHIAATYPKQRVHLMENLNMMMPNSDHEDKELPIFFLKGPTLILSSINSVISFFCQCGLILEHFLHTPSAYFAKF